LKKFKGKKKGPNERHANEKGMEAKIQKASEECGNGGGIVTRKKNLHEGEKIN